MTWGWFSEARREALATPTAHGLLSATDKAKLDAYPAYAALDDALPVGRLPYAYPPGVPVTGTYTTAVTLAAAGGARLIPIALAAPLLVASLTLYNTDTGTARSWEWRLYREPDGGGATLQEVAGLNGSEAFTPGGAASVRTVAATTPATTPPGLYWLALRCTHATNAFNVGAAAAGTLGGDHNRLKTLGSALGATLDGSTGWSPSTAAIAARLNGRVMGEGAIF